MLVLHGDNVHSILISGVTAMDMLGKPRESRFGDVLVIDGPVTTVYENPEQRVVFWAERDANPFFHFMESLWMMAGRDDVAWLSQFSSNISQFSDNGETFHGAYGYRWKHHFKNVTYTQSYGPMGSPDNEVIKDIDQLSIVVEMLKENPDERRCVVQMWDAESDLGRAGKDIPCNTQIMFSINIRGELDMTVSNRSNDMVWGAYGANAVHFSFLQEIMASRIGVKVGKYWQISNNFHAYLKTFEQVRSLKDHKLVNPYADGEVTNYPIMNTEWETWNADLQMFMDEGSVPGFKDSFFRRVVSPMEEAWFTYKNKENPNRYEDAILVANNISATDWRKACVEWLQRRMK